MPVANAQDPPPDAPTRVSDLRPVNRIAFNRFFSMGSNMEGVTSALNEEERLQHNLAIAGGGPSRTAIAADLYAALTTPNWGENNFLSRTMKNIFSSIVDNKESYNALLMGVMFGDKRCRGGKGRCGANLEFAYDDDSAMTYLYCRGRKFPKPDGSVETVKHENENCLDEEFVDELQKVLDLGIAQYLVEEGIYPDVESYDGFTSEKMKQSNGGRPSGAGGARGARGGRGAGGGPATRAKRQKTYDEDPTYTPAAE